MKATLTHRIRSLFSTFALGFLVLGIASCGGGGSSAPTDGSVIGSPSNGGSEGSADGAEGAGDGGGAGSGTGTSNGNGSSGGSGDSASSGGIGGTGGAVGGGNGDTGTADSGGSGGGIGGTGSPSTAGAVHFYLADAPSCGYDAVYVTVQKVRIHASGSAGDADAGWSEVVQTPLKRVDLLTLTNGVFADLGQTSLPAGKYTQLRLVLAENGPTPPFANAVVPTGGSETDLKVPSGTQSGLKIDADVDVVAGKTTNLVLDFDACKSVVRRGNSGQFNLKPVISAVPLASEVGLRVTGYVAPALANASTRVSVQVNGVPVRSTAPESTGRFVLYPVPAGTYDVVVTSSGRVPAVVTGVPVVTTAPTTVSSTGRPLDPPPSIERGVAGNLNPPTATVRALQPLSGGRSIEVGWAPVDAQNGRFAFTLPTDAPVRATYAANPAPLAFVADPTSVSKVTLEATSGTQLKVQPIDLFALPTSVTFTFP
jgi:Domain of unknown function (DUF4382)